MSRVLISPKPVDKNGARVPSVTFSVHEAGAWYTGVSGSYSVPDAALIPAAIELFDTLNAITPFQSVSADINGNVAPFYINQTAAQIVLVGVIDGNYHIEPIGVFSSLVDQKYDDSSDRAQSGVAISTVINHHHLPEFFGIVGDYVLSAGGGTDDKAAMQEYAQYCNDNRIPVFHLPTHHQNYRLDSPVVFDDPNIHIQGDRYGTYMRTDSLIKDGNIIVGVGSHGFTLGDGVAPGEPYKTKVGMWAVSGLSFLPYNFAAQKSKTGIVVDRQTNGPDRGIIFRGISANRMYAGIHQAPARPGVTIAGANWVVEGCCLSSNRYGILSEAPIYGLRFVGNQAEINNNSADPANVQNGGAIHGNFQGGVTIMDNMLEGQPNAVNLDASNAAIRAEISRNYIEKNNVNNSEYVFRFKTAFQHLYNRLTLGPNFSSGTEFPDDYAVIEGQGNWVIDMKDNFPVTFRMWAGSVLKGSNLFSQDIKHFRVSGTMNSKAPEIALGDRVARDESGGELLTVTVTNGGTGYTDGETVTLNSLSGEGYGATGTVAVTAGAVTSVAIVEAGYSYADGTNISINGGDAIAQGAASAKDWTHFNYKEGVKSQTQWGEVFGQDCLESIPITMSFSPGDLVMVTALVKIDDVTAPIFRAQLTNASGAFLQSLGDSLAPSISSGEWALVSHAVLTKNTLSQFGFRYAVAGGGSAKGQIAAVCVRNYGQHADDGSQTQDVFPVVPEIA